MTICIGVKLGDRVILAADSRSVTGPDRQVTDDYQKLFPIRDTLWAAVAGNKTFTSYLIGLLQESRDNPCGALLTSLKPFADSVFRIQREWYRLTAPSYVFLAGLLLGEHDPSARQGRLWAWKSDEEFTPKELQGDLVVLPEDAMERVRAAVEAPLAFGGDESLVKVALRRAIVSVSTQKEDVGPHGHIVTIGADGARLEEF